MVTLGSLDPLWSVFRLVCVDTLLHTPFGGALPGALSGTLWAPFDRPVAHFGLWGWSWGALWASFGFPGRSFEALGASRILFGTWWGGFLVGAFLLV